MRPSPILPGRGVAMRSCSARKKHSDSRSASDKGTKRTAGSNPLRSSNESVRTVCADRLAGPGRAAKVNGAGASCRPAVVSWTAPLRDRASW